jgi:intein/homing endonuclease
MHSFRVNCDESDLKSAVRDLRSSGYTNESISKEIGTRIDSCIYRGHKMSLESFDKLLEISDMHIDHQIVADNRYNARNIPELSPNKQLSELFGIILGDGHMQNRSKKGHKTGTTTYFISITLNEEEDEIIDRSEYLLEEITNLDVKRYEKQGKCVRLVIHSKDAVEKFQEMGLEAGDKIENQVSVPRWIKQSEEFCRRCLKGLIDTDGCIYKDQRKNTYYERVQFKNYSEPLLKDFRRMCSYLGIRTVKGGPKQIQISRKHVVKFIRTIDPIKARYLAT